MPLKLDRVLTTLAILLLVGTHESIAKSAEPSLLRADDAPVTLYDPNPDHLWNRLHAAFWVRTGPDGRRYGSDRLDPLLWVKSRHLLEGPSRDAAMKVLKEFLDGHGERLIDDPLKRAVLQRDLWAIFDWVANPHVDDMYRDLGHEESAPWRRPLAEAIGRLAMDRAAIDKLPDTYALAIASKQFPVKFDPEHPSTSYLPPDLFEAKGPWVCLGRNGSDIIVPAHSRDLSRSTFQVFLNLPGGRNATVEYVSRLSSFKEPFRLTPLSDGRFVRTTNPNVPQFPAGTQVALVRSAMVIDRQAQIRPTRIIESIQLRVYRELASQEGYEFILHRASLFAGTSGGFREVPLDERDFLTGFNLFHFDIIEQSRSNGGRDFPKHGQVVRQSCVGCHREPGVASFNTFAGGFSPPDLLPSFFESTSRERDETAAVRHKKTRYDWGLLEGLLDGEQTR